MVGDVVPEKSSRGIVHIWFSKFQGIFIGYGTLVVVNALLAAIGDLPGFLVVIACDGCSGPIVSITRDLAAVIEIVEYTELQSELVLIRSDIRAVHSERWVAVAHL